MSDNNVLTKAVFILGAGASVDAGCKTSPDMLSNLLTRINGITNERQKRIFSEIYSFIIATLKYKFSLEKQDELAQRVINIEDFFMMLRQLLQKDSILPDPFIGNWNQKITKWEFTQEDIFDEFMRFIITNLREHWTKHDDKKAEDLVSQIKLLCAQASVEKLDFFTLNYDLVFESQFESGKEIDVGFSKGVWTSTFDNYPDQEGGESLDPIKLKYYKLHGSLDWWYDEDDEEILVKDVDKVGKPLIVFGTDDKVISVDPFLYLLGKFRERLSQSDLYVIIGYSFSDHHINNLLIQELKRDAKRRILVVDPFYKGKNKKQAREELLQYIADVQTRKSSREFKNRAKLSDARVDIIQLTAKEFYREYFNDGAKKLQKYYEEMLKEEKIF